MAQLASQGINIIQYILFQQVITDADGDGAYAGPRQS
jgi:hypothetical protein